MPPFQNEHFLSSPREVRGIHQAVVPAADNNDVVFFCHQDLPRYKDATFYRCPQPLTTSGILRILCAVFKSNAGFRRASTILACASLESESGVRSDRNRTPRTSNAAVRESQ